MRSFSRVSPLIVIATVVLATGGCPGGEDRVDVDDDAGSQAGGFARDTGGAATQTVGPAGGNVVVEVAGGQARIEIPAGALLEPTAITLTPLTGFAAAGFVGGVDFQPEGLAFLEPVVVHLPRTDWVLGYHAEGQDPYLVSYDTEGDDAVILVTHFSGLATGNGPLPGSAPVTAGDRALDASARGNIDQVRQHLREAFVEADIAAAAAGTDRAALQRALELYAAFDGLLQQLDEEATFATQTASLKTRLSAALLLERDRITQRSIAANDWKILLEIEAFIIPRADFLGLANEGPLTRDALSRAVPMTVTVDQLELAYDNALGRFVVEGRGRATLQGGTVVTVPGLDLTLNMTGAVEPSITTTTEADGSFAVAFVPKAERVGASIVARFSGLPVLDVTGTAAIEADNDAPLGITATLDPSSFDEDSGSNLVVEVVRGSGPLGSAGVVALSVQATVACRPGSTGGVPDVDGRLLSTIDCDGAGTGTITATVTHRGQTATSTASFTVTGDGPVVAVVPVWRGIATLTSVVDRDLDFGSSRLRTIEEMVITAEVECTADRPVPVVATCVNLSRRATYTRSDERISQGDCVAFNNSGECTTNDECLPVERCVSNIWDDTLNCTGCTGTTINTESSSMSLDVDLGTAPPNLQFSRATGRVRVSMDTQVLTGPFERNFTVSACSLRGPNCPDEPPPPASSSSRVEQIDVAGFAVDELFPAGVPATGPLAGSVTSPQGSTLTFSLERQN